MSMKMHNVFALIAGGLLIFGLNTSALAACTNATPCTMTLYVLPPPAGTSPIHMTYGDTLVLSYNGNKTDLIPSVAGWEPGTINLKAVDLFFEDPPGSGTGRIIPAWEFKFKSSDSSHVPNDKDHLTVHLYKNPDSAGNDWVLKDAVHSDGSVHGGSVHMIQ